MEHRSQQRHIMAKTVKTHALAEQMCIRDRSEYALSHMDECCVVFSKGYSYQSKYQGARYYTQFMRNSAPVENQVEYSFELNAHNKALLDQIKNAKRRSEALRRYPGSFAETLVEMCIRDSN